MVYSLEGLSVGPLLSNRFLIFFGTTLTLELTDSTEVLTSDRFLAYESDRLLSFWVRVDYDLFLICGVKLFL